MADVFEFSKSRGNDRLVLLAIADEANDDGKGGYPGFDLLAAKCRLPKTTVRRAVDRLEEAGELRVTRPEKKGRGHYTTYEVITAKERATLAPSESGQNGPERATTGHKGPERAAAPPLTCIDGQYAVPSTRNAKEKDSPPAAFDRFWAAYPAKVAKGAARKAWPKALQAAGDAERIIAGAERYAVDPNREPGFTAHPSTWLNAERWDDDPLPPKPSTSRWPETPEAPPRREQLPPAWELDEHGNAVPLEVGHERAG
jgi:DNA-binding MarR family transcriptional regulator